MIDRFYLSLTSGQMVDSVATVIGRAGLPVLVVLLLAAPAEATTTTHTWRVGPVDMRAYATEQALESTRAPEGSAI